MARATPVQIAKAKADVLDALGKGMRVADAVVAAGRSEFTYKDWYRTDPEFRAQVLRIRNGLAAAASESLPSFEEFSEQYLGQKVFPHMLNVVDVIEGKPPRWTHDSMVYEPGEPDLAIVNMPPEHPAAFSTPLFTTSRGWITMGEVTEDDWIVGPEGFPCPIVETWTSPRPVPVFDVQFSSGDVIRTSAEHKWNAYPVFAGTAKRGTAEQVTTAQLMKEPGKWRIPVAPAWDGPEQSLPLDPYLFGYWLGDGNSAGAGFAVGDEDTDAFTAELDAVGLSYRVSRDSRGRSNVVYVHDIRKHLPLGNKHIPTPYFLGSYEQRLALLQGLMDSDGTITKKDSRARFVQHREPLARDVYRLVASLGLKPHLKNYGDAWEVGFRTGVDPVFRLERKATKQRPAKGTSKSAHRVVKKVTPAGVEPVRCITALTDTNEYCIGDGMILTRNAKSTTITMNYVTWRINKDPNIRVIVVSKTQAMARKFLYGIKTRLTHSRYQDAHIKFGPPGGWDANSGEWSQDKIYVSAESRDSGEKDPTVEALGIRGHIYGARADLIVLDDPVDLTNAHEYEKQIEWIMSEVLSRISASGMCLLVGTRLAARDLYSEIRDPNRYPDEESPWTYLSMPAVLEFKEDPEDWVTLWPRSNQPELGAKGELAEQGPDGLYPKWDGKRLVKKRGRMNPRTWALVYQQQHADEESIFSSLAVKGVVNGNRLTGVIPRGMHNTRPDGMDGLVCFAGLDPAMAGHTSCVAIGLDLRTQKRYVLDVWDQAGMTPDQIRDLIREWTDKYAIVEWRIEKNAFQSMLTQDREVREYLAAKGCVLREHHTGVNKWNVDFGVASLTMLFEGYKDGKALIELPSTYRAEGVKALVEQLVMWVPDPPKNQKTDCVMALWFTELACRDRIAAMSAFGKSHVRNRWSTPWDRRQQTVFNLAEAEQAGLWHPVT